MNQKLDSDDNHPPSGFFLKIKKFFKNPFFIKTQSVSEVTDFLKDAVDLNIIDKEAESIASKAIRLGSITIAWPRIVSASLSRSSALSTEPQGLWGELIITMRVRGVMARASASKSIL